VGLSHTKIWLAKFTHVLSDLSRPESRVTVARVTHVPSTADLPPSATVTVPPWMWGADPAQYFAAAGLRSRPVDGSPGRWQLRTQERYHHIHPSLITVDHLAGPVTRRPRFDLLAGAARGSVAPDDGQHLPNELAARHRRAGQTCTLVDAIVLWQLQTIAAPLNELAGVTEQVHFGLTTIGAEDDPDRKPFVAAGVHLVRRAPEVVHRAKLTSVLLQVQHDPRLLSGDVDHLRSAYAAGDPLFAASQSLYDGIFVFDAYLGPLLGALTPSIWAFSATRVLGVIVYSLGQPLAGTPGDAVELLQVLPSQGAREASPVPTLPPTAAGQALEWWTNRLSDMFAVLTDPAVFTDRDAVYHPAKHLHALLTVEQLFRRVSSIQTVHRDTNARRVLLFSVLDTLERLTGRPVDVLCCLSFARQRLEKLTAELAPEVGTVLLPAAQRAVKALRRMQDGFYLRQQRGAETIDVPVARGDTRSLKPDQAAAEYIKVLRDATHGHGSNRAGRVGLTNALLAHHDGTIPHDLALLGYLYLLDVLTQPAVLAQQLYRGGHV